MNEPAVFDGVGVPGKRYTARGATTARFIATLGLLALGLGVGMGVLGVWDRLVADQTTYNCPPDCGRPPNALPVETLPRFFAPDGTFSVAYPAPGGAYALTISDDGVLARWTGGGGGVLHLFSQPARGRVARQVVQQLMAQQYPNASIAYELPNAMVGYQVGYGVAVDFQPAGLSAKYDMRAIIVAAVKNDVALIALADGPFRRFSPDFGPGPPSAANLEIAIDMGKYVESFIWQGDPPR